ncbi:MAG: SUMF1/EgtB/PvdO family nonheme iron enzyme [Candidatus Marinimicrobia bacterium]|nr:SUMF1/EgtB/PvdO family nonheme iron enzyme [Candidatus Neomarinimicrobiota bacterium]
MRKHFILISVLFTFILNTCSVFGPKADETPPVLVLEYPTGLETVSETVIVSCLAADDEGIAGTELYVDNKATGLIDTTAPYTFNWNTTLYPDGTSHTLYVKGWDINENFANSDTVTVVVNNADVHPAPIEDLSITFQAIGYRLSWSPNTHPKFSAYELQRSAKVNMDSSATIFSSTDSLASSHFDSTANPLLTYYYQINVIDSSGFVSESEVLQSPQSDIYLPTGLTATPGDTTIRLRWNDNSPFEESFVIVRDGGEGYEYLTTVEANATTFIDNQLDYDIQYRYQVAVVYAGVTAGLTSYALANSPLLFAPTNLAAASTAQLTIELGWEDNCIFEAGFRLERKKAGLSWVEIAELGPNVTSYVDTALSYDIWYSYRVSAFTPDRISGYATYFSIYSPLLFSPTNLAARATDTTIVLTWLDRCTFESGFIIERGEGSVNSNGYVPIDTVGADVVSYVDSNLEEGIWYWYRVAAFLPDERSGYSSTSNIYSPIVFAPINLSATALDTSISLRWVDNCIFEDGFILERDAGPGWLVIAELDANITGFVDTDMEYGVNYTYRVAAIADGIMSNYSYPATRFSPLQFAPSSLSVNTVGNGIQLVWNDNCIFEGGFVVQRDGGSDYVTIAQLGSNATSFRDDDMDFDVIYRYRVAAFVVPSAPSSFSYSGSIRSPLSYAPTNLAAVSTDTSITLYWQDECLFEEGFIIERNSGAGYIEIGTSASNVTTFTDTSLSEGEFYYYRVAAFSSVTDPQISDYSFSVVISSPIVFAPVSLFASTLQNSIIIRWLDFCTFEDGFRVERDGGSGFEVLATLGQDATSYTDVDMEYAISYRYRVAAFDGSIQSNYSNIVERTSPLSFTPSALFAYINPTSIDLTWQDNCIFEDGFKIERDAGNGFVEIGQVVTDVTSYTDTDLLEDLTYRYRISAFTATLQSDYSQIITVPSPIEFAPVNLDVNALSESLQLTWVDNCVFEEGFKVERNSGSGFVEIAELGPNYTFYSDSDLGFNLLYSYRVAAFTSERQSDYTSIVTISSPMELSPSNLSATAVGNQIELNWDDNSQLEDGYRIERNQGSGFVQIAEPGADVTSYTDYGLNYGISYSYRVLAFVGLDESDYTNTATAAVGWLVAEWDVVSTGTYTIGHASVPGGVFDYVVGSEYEIMRYEVTNAQYATYLEEALIAGEVTGVTDIGFSGGGNLYYNLALTNKRIQWDGFQVTISEGYELYPVSGVTWYGAKAFATHYGWDLPTDQEWEVAARADSEADYPWGNADPNCDLANYAGCNDGLIPVGQTSGISPFGAYDMVGNTWEWTDSFFDGGNDSYSFRGGSWSYFTDNLKVWFRTEGVPTASYNTIGFRCVR